MAPLTFGPWLPDSAEFLTGAARIALNVIPGSTSYRPFLNFEPYATDSISGQVVGMFSCVSSSGTVYNFAGNRTNLFKASSDGLTWGAVSRLVGGAYSVSSEHFWTFSQFGNVVMAQNGTDEAQVFILDVSANFIDDTNIPVGRYAGTLRAFSVVANLNSDSKTIAWSGIYDPLDWTPSDINLSDSQYMPDGGEITGFVGGEVGVLFQRRAIQRMVFTGPPLTFSFDKISSTLGCRVPGSIAAYGDLIFFCSENGMHMIRGGQEIVPIGEGKIDLWLASNFNFDGMWNVSAAINPLGKTYIMSFPTKEAANGVPNTFLIYHWPTGKWSIADVAMDWIYAAITQSGYNLDTIDALNPLPSTTGIDGMPFSFDSGVFTGKGNLQLSAINRTGFSGFFTGIPRRAQVETGAIQPVQGRKALLLGGRPLVEGELTDVRMYTATSDKLQSAFQGSGAQSANSRGFVPMRNSGRYHRLGVVIPEGSGPWINLDGIDDLKFKAQSV